MDRYPGRIAIRVYGAEHMVLAAIAEDFTGIFFRRILLWFFLNRFCFNELDKIMSKNRLHYDCTTE